MLYAVIDSKYKSRDKVITEVDVGNRNNNAFEVKASTRNFFVGSWDNVFGVASGKFKVIEVDSPDLKFNLPYAIINAISKERPQFLWTDKLYVF